MSRMLEALRRLEAAELLVGPPAPAVEKVESDEANESVVDTLDVPATTEDEVKSAVPDAEVATPLVTSPSSRIAHDQVPFEPAFSPLDSWEDDADSYASAGYDDDWDEPAAGDTPAATAEEPTLAESLASEVLAKIERAKQLAVAAAQEEPHVASDDSPVATGGSPAASSFLASAGEPPAPREPTGLCPQCLEQLVDLRDERPYTPVADETDANVVADPHADVEPTEHDEVSTPDEANESHESTAHETVGGDDERVEAKVTQSMPEGAQWWVDANETIDDPADPADSQSQSPTGVASHSPASQSPIEVASHKFEWEDLFPDVALHEKEAETEPAASDEDLESATRVTEPFTPPVVDSPDSLQIESESIPNAANEVDVDVEAVDVGAELNLADDVEMTDALDSSAGDEATDEQEAFEGADTQVVPSTEYSIPSTNVKLDVEPSDKSAEQSAEPPVELPAEISTPYSVLSTDIEAERIDSKPDLEPAPEALEQSAVLSDEIEATSYGSDEAPAETSIGEDSVVGEDSSAVPSTEYPGLNADLEAERNDSEPDVEPTAEAPEQSTLLSDEIEAAPHESGESPVESIAGEDTDVKEEPSLESSTQYSVLSTDESELPTEVESEDSARALDIPATSGAERAALADLGDPLLAKQITDLGQRVMSDLGVTTHPSAALVGAEHQPHVTDVALRTAMSLALAGRQVLLVDAALADKHLTSGLGLSAEFGLSETLKGRVPWQQAVRATATPGLCVLPAGRITPPTLFDGDKRLASLLKELSSQWELVLLDAGSCHDSTAPPVIKSARNVYLLVRMGETETEAAAAAIATIEKTGAKLRGAVATNA